MSSIKKRVIWAGPADGSNHKPLNVEGKATEAILPGSSVAYAAANAGLKKSTSDATVFGEVFMVADKNQQQTKSVDTAWTINENMVAIQPRSGEFVNVLVITGQALVPGTPLSRSATAGALKVALTNGTEDILCYADETITTTATQLVHAKVA